MMWIFFYKQKKAYEMRISDWSSDVCFADLAQRGGDQGAGRRSGEDAFALKQLARRQHRLPVGNLVGLAHARQVGDVGQEVLADAFDHPAPDLLAEVPGLDVFGEDRALGVGQHHLGLVGRSEEHTSELQSLMRISYAVFCL